MSTEPAAVPENLNLRIRGLFLGAAVGDALGWPQEQRSGIVGGQSSRRVSPRADYRDWERNAGTRFGRYQEVVRRGEYSDDTQLLLAVARCCLRGDAWWDYLTRVELPTWLLYQRGAGRAVISASRCWQSGAPPWSSPGTARPKSVFKPVQYFGAGANGVAMRVAPHVVVALNDDPHTLATRVIRDGIATHGHPRALVGALVHALMLRKALQQTGTLEYGDLVEQILNEQLWQQAPIEDAVPEDWLRAFEQHSGEPVQVAWKRTVDELEALLQTVREALARGALANDEATLKNLGCFDPATNGAGTVTTAASAYLAARSAARPMSGLLRAAFLEKADTDTLASMTSSLLGALHGPDWLGELGRHVQDAEYLVRVSELIVQPRTAGRSQPALFDNELPSDPRTAKTFVNQRRITRFLDEMSDQHPGDSAKFLDGRRCVLAERSAPEVRANISVTRLRLLLEDGQTIVIDQTHRDQSRSRSTRGTTNLSSSDTHIEHTGDEPTKAHKRDHLVAQKHSGSVASVTLIVKDLPAVAHFYRNILGLPVRGSRGGFVTVGEWLLIRQSSDSEDHPNQRPQAIIEIMVADLDDVRRRIGEESLEQGAPDVLQLRDPEGNLVFVRSRPTDTS